MTQTQNKLVFEYILLLIIITIIIVINLNYFK